MGVELGRGAGLGPQLPRTKEVMSVKHVVITDETEVANSK